MNHWKMKNVKFLLDIQTKCSDLANEILNAAIDAERTFKCEWPYRKDIIKKIQNSNKRAMGRGGMGAERGE